MGARLFFLIGPPFAVVLPLLLLHDLFAVFACYHLGFCLVLPLAVDLGARRWTLRRHLAALGLAGPGTGRGLALGLALGTALASAILLVFAALGDAFLGAQRIGSALAALGAGPGRQAAVFWFMVLVNGPAEELYWRGFVHHELVGGRAPGRTILLIAACYASYHPVPGHLLNDRWWVTALFLVFIWLAGAFWGWLRLRTGSVWPPLLGHAGAVVGYMIVAKPYLAV